LHLEAGFTNIAYLNYQHTKLKNSTIAGETNSIRNSFSLGSNLNNFNSSLYVGFRLLLNKK
ncbi:MAG: hypothetical protein HYR66_11625, partial [Sphingobacteriales bacterium]|nr:hypothetical protein [Sphingobacteriales bacterium]